MVANARVLNKRSMIAQDTTRSFVVVVLLYLTSTANGNGLGGTVS